MTWLRTLLFVPGNRPGWVEKAAASGPDGLILDMEDSVAMNEKGRARQLFGDTLRSGGLSCYVIARINAFNSGLAEDDLDAVVRPGLNAIFLPKVERPEDVIRLDHSLAQREQREGLSEGAIRIFLIFETAYAVYSAFHLMKASPRVEGIIGPGGKGADTNRALGYTWTREGLETLYVRSKILLEGRAAGVRHLLGFGWMNTKDLDGLLEDAGRCKQLGYQGYAVIHPSHVQPVNKLFTPSQEQISEWRAIIASIEEAEREGYGAASMNGEIVDLAHAESARQGLEIAKSLGLISEV